MKKYIIIFVLLFLSQGDIFAQGSPPPPPPPPGGGGPSCWPPSPTCDPTQTNPVPLNDGIWILLIAGTAFFFAVKKESLAVK